MASTLLPLRSLISIVVMILCGVLANWSYTYVEVVDETTQTTAPNFIEDSYPSVPPQMSAAGWPSKYLLSIAYDDAPALSVVGVGRLIFNLAIWTAFTVALVLYERRISRVLAKNDNHKRRLSIFDLLVLTAVIAAIIIYVRTFASASAREGTFIGEISPRGGSVRSTLALPTPVANLFDRFHLELNRYSRVTEVRLLNPSQEQVATALKLPYLRKLYIGGGNYDLRLLDQLATKPLLQVLRISGRQLDPQSIAAIGAAKQLVAVNLMRTNINANGVTALGKMPRLRMLNLIHTDVELSELDVPPCAQTIQYLFLPRPRKGDISQLKLAGWSNLIQLEINEYDEQLNAEPVGVDLSNLPQLQTVTLDSLQKFDLRLENLPELIEVKPQRSQWETRVIGSKGIPDGVWLQNVYLSNVPKLSEIKVYASDLDRIDFAKPTPVNLRLSSSRLVVDAPSDHVNAAQSIAKDRVNAWLASLAGENGPSRLELQGIPLKGTDFSLLTGNSRLSTLALTGSDVSLDDLLQLGDLPALRELDLSGCYIDGRGLAKVLSKLPQLTKIACDPSGLGRLRLQHQPHLETIFSTVVSRASQRYYSPTDALHLVDLPSLKESFDLPPGVIFLHIEDAPSLTGLSLSSPWPNNAVFTGLRDLEYLCIGGSRVDDGVCEAILACKNLSRLTLAFTSISPEMLAKLGALRKLRSLTLTGSNATDEVIAQLSELTELQNLRLDQTAITDAALTVIAKFPHLDSLSLHGHSDHGDWNREFSKPSETQQTGNWQPERNV